MGQRHAVTTLRRLVRAGAPHAYLFHGPSGVGKTTLARILAHNIGCPHPLEIDAATHSGVQEVRNVLQFVTRADLHGYPRVVISDECHQYRKQAWQTMLKVVEEPPRHLYFIFCTTEPESMPRTIRTRCHEFRLSTLDDDHIAELVSRAADREGMDLGDDMLSLVVEASNGTPRLALVYLSIVSQWSTVKQARKAIAVAATDGLAMTELCRAMGARDFVDLGRVMDAVWQLTRQSDPEPVRIAVMRHLSTLAMNTRNTRYMSRLCHFTGRQFYEWGDIVAAVYRCTEDEEQS